MQQTDFAFANDVRAAVDLRMPRTSRMLLASSLALLVSALVWAHFAVLDEVKRGNGKVVPSRQIQVVQSLVTPASSTSSHPDVLQPCRHPATARVW